MMRWLFTLLMASSFCARAAAQDIVVRAVDGKSGKPLPGQRLLVYSFDDLDHRHQTSFDLHTNERGEAGIPAQALRGKKLQVWVDFMTSCLEHPNLAEWDVAKIEAEGLSTPNTCNKQVQVQALPKQLILYVRKPSLAERLSW